MATDPTPALAAITPSVPVTTSVPSHPVLETLDAIGAALKSVADVQPTSMGPAQKRQALLPAERSGGRDPHLPP